VSCPPGHLGEHDFLEVVGGAIQRTLRQSPAYLIDDLPLLDRRGIRRMFGWSMRISISLSLAG